MSRGLPLALAGLLLLPGCGALDRALSDDGDPALAAEASARADDEAVGRGVDAGQAYAPRPVSMVLSWPGEPGRRSSTTFSGGSCGYQADGTWRARSDGSLSAETDASDVFWELLDVVTDAPADGSTTDGTGTVPGAPAAASLTVTGSTAPASSAGAPGPVSGTGSLLVLDAQGGAATFTAPPARPSSPADEQAPLDGVVVEIVCGPPL